MMKYFLKSIIIMVLLIVALDAGKVYAKGAKVEIWSYDLGERIEHRSISVGNEMSGFGMMITPSNLKVEDINWSIDNKNIAEIKENESKSEVNVCGVEEGTTKLNLAVQTKTEGKLEHSSIISVYTPINDVEAYISQTTTFYRGADEKAWVRSDNVAPKQKITIIGSCGKYYYVKLPDDYKFDDDRSSRYTYTLKANVYIPVTNVVLSRHSITLQRNKAEKVDIDVKPSIATNASINFEALNKNIVSIDENGNIKAIKEGYTKVLAQSEQKSVKDECGVSVYEPIDMVEAEINESCNLYIGADGNEQIRSYNVNKGQKLTIIGLCDKFYYVKLPENYKFDDNSKERMAYVEKSKLYIPVKKIILDMTEITIKRKEKVKLNVKVEPSIATNKTIKWKSLNKFFATTDQEGNITGEKTGKTVVMAINEENGVKAVCNIRISEDIYSNILGKIELKVVETDFGINVLEYSNCIGATEYNIWQGIEKKGKIKWQKCVYECYGNLSKGKKIRIVNAVTGKKYYYKAVAKSADYAVYAKTKREVLGTATSNIVKVKTGVPELKAVRKDKNIVLGWKKMNNAFYKKGGYIIYKKKNGTFKEIAVLNNNDKLKYKDQDVKTNKQYYYKIKAFYIKNNKSIKSPFSKSVLVKQKGEN